jgi:nuclease S1
MLAKLLFFVAAAISVPSALAWDDFGHRLVARLAYLKLEPDVKAKVDDLLGGGVEAFIEASQWADRIKAGRPNTAPWHYVNVPLEAEGYDRARDCPKSNCIVEKLAGFVDVLKSNTATKPERREALRFMLHLVADVHQPLRCADHNDRGGIDVGLVWEKKMTNLREVWDHYVLTNTLHQLGDATADGTVVDWCNESHEISRRVVYEGLPGSGRPVSQTYIEIARGVATDRLARAAARLATLLNETLGAASGNPESRPLNSTFNAPAR